MRRLAFVVATLLPTLALAAGPEVLNLKDGVPREVLGKTLGVAWGLLGLSLALGLLVEAFGDSPTQPKQYAAVAWRALLVTALLASYPKVFGTVIATAEALAERLAPKDVWETFARRSAATIETLASRKAPPPPASDGSLSAKAGQLLDGLKSSADFVTAYVGGTIFDSLVALFVACAQAFQWAFFQLSRLLLTVLYVVGPLALVFHIPGPSRTAGRWFTAFVNIATWPIFSSLLLALATGLLFRTHDASAGGAYATAFGAVASSLLIVLLNLAVPFLASAVVGGGAHNILAPALGLAALGMAKTGALAPDAAQRPKDSAPGGSGASPSAGGTATSAPTPSQNPTASPSPADATAGSTGPVSVPPGAAPPVASVPTGASAFPLSATVPGRAAIPARPPPDVARFPRPPGLSTNDMTLPPPTARAAPPPRDGPGLQFDVTRLPRPPGLSTNDMTLPAPEERTARPALNESGPDAVRPPHLPPPPPPDAD